MLYFNTPTHYEAVTETFFPLLIIVGLYYGYTEFGSSLLAKVSPQAQKSANNVLGAANKVVMKQASRSADFASSIILQKASEPLVREFYKLPVKQQKILQKQICK